MDASFQIPLTLAYVHSAPVAQILSELKRWLQKENPICLVHPHGFCVILLGRTEAEDWRLHIWPSRERIVSGMPAFIHTHDRCIESRILKGSMTNVLYDVREVKVGGFPLYEVIYGGDRYLSKTSNFLSKTNIRVEPKSIQRQKLESGDVYRVERDVYHEVIVPEGALTVTIVCMHSFLPSPVLLVGQDGFPSSIVSTRVERRASEIFDNEY